MQTKFILDSYKVFIYFYFCQSNITKYEAIVNYKHSKTYYTVILSVCHVSFCLMTYLIR